MLNVLSTQPRETRDHTTINATTIKRVVWPTAGLPVTGCASTESDLSDPDPLKPSVTNSLIANLNDTVSLGLRRHLEHYHLCDACSCGCVALRRILPR